MQAYVTDEGAADPADPTSPDLVPDGVFLHLSIASDVLGGAGDPRAADAFDASGFTVQGLANSIEDYVARGDREGFLEGYEYERDLLLRVAQAVREQAQVGG